MGNLRFLPVAALLVSALNAWAQSAPAPAPAASASGKTTAEAAESAAAMERAQRMANNPMRVILEAGRFKRRAAVENEPAPEPADAANLRRTSVRSGGVESSSTTTPAPTPAPAPLPRPAPEVLRTTASELIAPGATTESPGLEAAPKAAAMLAVMPAAAVPTQRLAELRPPAPPQLLVSVEPLLPGRLAEEASRIGQVLVDLTLNADGSVGNAALASQVPRPLQRPILDAMAKWRFDPQPEGRIHRVQLIFGDR